jgi:hypothetical protein
MYACMPVDSRYLKARWLRDSARATLYDVASLKGVELEDLFRTARLNVGILSAGSFLAHHNTHLIHLSKLSVLSSAAHALLCLSQTAVQVHHALSGYMLGSVTAACSLK